MYLSFCFQRIFEWFAFPLDSGTSFIGVVMATDSKSGAERDLSNEDPLQVPSDQTETIKIAFDDFLKSDFCQAKMILVLPLSHVLMN